MPRDLGISQPAVTKQLSNLEREVGARLMERSARSIRLTPQGKALYQATREPLAATIARIANLYGQPTGYRRVSPDRQ